MKIKFIKSPKKDKIPKPPKYKNPLYVSTGITKPKFWKQKITENMFPGRVVLINMELLNGMHRTFLIKEVNDGFSYRAKKYIFDSDNKYFNIDAKMYCYDFHESFTLPIKKKIPITDIKKTLEQSELTEVEYATNPATLERFIVARIAEGIMKGQQLDDWMKQIRVMLVVIMIAVIIHLLLFVSKSGMLQQIKIPGVN